MATFILPRALDANGNPVSGALAKIYEADGTTPATVYSDEAMTTAHDWPIEYTSAGAPPAAYVADGVYKLDLQTSGGVSIPGFPVDDIPIGRTSDFITPPTLEVLTGSGTYTAPDNCPLIVVRGKGGGGGGGGVDGVGAGEAVAGGGGGEGAWFVKWIQNPSGDYTYSNGLGGAGGAAGNNNGSDGTDTTFTNGSDIDITAGGGKGGSGRLATANTQAAAAGGDGGTATGGDVNIDGERGRAGVVGSGHVFVTGNGAGSGTWGRAAVPAQISGTTGSVDGADGQGFGSGGSGAQVAGVSNNRAGGDGAPGRLEIEVYS